MDVYKECELKLCFDIKQLTWKFVALTSQIENMEITNDKSGCPLPFHARLPMEKVCSAYFYAELLLNGINAHNT